MPLDAHLILADGYDREAFQRTARGLAPELDDLTGRGDRLAPHFQALVEDLFCALFKLVIQVRPEDACPRSTALNRRVLGALLGSDDYRQLKDVTSLDPARAMHGALILARRALTLLRSGEVLLDDELLAAQALARVEDELAEKKAVLEEARGSESPLADELERQVDEGERQRDALAREVGRSLDELPPRFASDLSNTAERLGGELEELEEKAEGFSRAVGAGGNGDAAVRLRLAERLRTSRKLEQLARLAGAFRAEARAARKKRRERASEELFRVGRGADLARLLPVELLALRHPLRRLDFMRRFVEGELSAYELRGSDRHGRGPLVVCLDGSGSMAGDRELWSKAVALALLDIARRQGRRARAIVFSGPEAPLSTFELTAAGRRAGRTRVDLDGVVALAECFPGGGTDFERPLQAAAEALEESRYAGGDVVFITDGEARLGEPFCEAFAESKRQRDFAVYGVVVDDPTSRNRVAGGAGSQRAIDELRKVADEVTTVSRLTADSLRGLFEAL